MSHTFLIIMPISLVTWGEGSRSRMVEMVQMEGGSIWGLDWSPVGVVRYQVLFMEGVGWRSDLNWIVFDIPSHWVRGTDDSVIHLSSCWCSSSSSSSSFLSCFLFLGMILFFFQFLCEWSVHRFLYRDYCLRWDLMELSGRSVGNNDGCRDDDAITI